MLSNKKPLAERALKSFRDKKTVNSSTLKLFRAETKATLNERFAKAIQNVEKLQYENA